MSADKDRGGDPCLHFKFLKRGLLSVRRAEADDGSCRRAYFNTASSYSSNGGALRLLHYFSPEIIFAIPSQPDTEFMIRFHHRSGGDDYFGSQLPVYGSLFRGSQGGMQYLTFGLRQHFCVCAS